MREFIKFIPICQVCKEPDEMGVFTYLFSKDEEVSMICCWCHECFDEYSVIINGRNPNAAVEAWEMNDPFLR